MAKICSFCKREVTNGVCCDYCGTPLIFSEDNGTPEEKHESKSEQKKDALYKNSDGNVEFSDDIEGEEIARREIKSGIKALYEQSRHLRENKNDSIFDASKENDVRNCAINDEKPLDNGNSNDLDKIKINIYNSEFANDNAFGGGETRVIGAEDIAMIKRQVEINRENAAHAQENAENPEDAKEKETIADTAETGESPVQIAEFENSDDDDNSQSCGTEENTRTGGENISSDEDESSENNEPSETYLRYMAAAQKPQPARKEDTKLAKFLKWVLGIMFLLGLVSLFFPSLNPAETSDTMSFSIVDGVLLATTFVGMCFAFFEKKGIRKFIYGIMFSTVFFAVYLVFARPFPPKNVKELSTLSYLLIMLIVSVFGHMASGGTKYEKTQVWFDTFSYLALVADLFSIALCAMLYFVIPGDIRAAMLPYVAAVAGIGVFALIGIILMTRRKIAGANMYLMSAIALIIVSMLAYNKIINIIGYYSSVISLMSAIGSGYSKFIALCVAYPIFMYMLLAFLKGKNTTNGGE